MNHALIRQMVNRQLLKMDIKDAKFYILKKEWGYIIQVDNRYRTFK